MNSSLVHTNRLVAENGLYLPPPGTGGGGGGITQLTGDVLAGPGAGSQPATVVRINGATVPLSGALIFGNVLQVNGVSALEYGPVNLASATSVSGLLPVANIAPSGTNGFVLTTVGGATVWTAAGGGGGITALTQDVTASGSGSVAATVVQAQAGVILFSSIGSTTGYLSSGNGTGYCLGATIQGTNYTTLALGFRNISSQKGAANAWAIGDDGTNTVINVGGSGSIVFQQDGPGAGFGGASLLGDGSSNNMSLQLGYHQDFGLGSQCLSLNAANTNPSFNPSHGALFYSDTSTRKMMLFNPTGAPIDLSLTGAAGAYTPSVPGNWSGAAPTTIQEALDRIAANTTNTHPIP